MLAFLRRRRLGHCRDEARRFLLVVLEPVRRCDRRPGVVAFGRRQAFAVSNRCLYAVRLRDRYRDPRKSQLCRAERDGTPRILVDTRMRGRPGLRDSRRRRLDARADGRGDRRRRRG
jgi:hypothetical protein